MFSLMLIIGTYDVLFTKRRFLVFKINIFCYARYGMKLYRIQMHSGYRVKLQDRKK